MKKKLNKKNLERYSRQIILKDVGIIGQKAIINSKVLIVGVGGLGCPIADYLCRSGVGTIGIVDFDKINLSNIQRQTLYETQDINKFKVDVLKKKMNLINPLTKVIKYNKKITEKNINKILKKINISKKIKLTVDVDPLNFS